MHDKDFTGLSINAIRSPVTARTTKEHYEEVVQSHEAVGSRYLIQAGEDGLPYVQTSLRVPFSDDGKSVGDLL